MTDKNFAQMPPSGIVTAMFTDIVNSTGLKNMVSGETSARRDAAFRVDIKEPHDRLVLDCIRSSGGYLVNPTGDGFCVTFVDAEEAVMCAAQIQRLLKDTPIVTPLGPLQIRIGLHTGVAGPTNGDYTAATVDKTARIQGQAEGGQILVSFQTHALVSGSVQGLCFRKAGAYDGKGKPPEDLYAVEELPPLYSGASDGSDGSDAHAANIHADDAERKNADESGKRKKMFAAVGLFVLLCGGMLCARLLPRLVASTGPPSTKPAASAPAASNVARSTASAGAGLTDPASALRPGSRWIGSFHFRPPIRNYSGSLTLTVLRRSGDTFEALYATENGAYEWRVTGAVRGGNARWEFLKALKNLHKEDAVGKAYVEATIAGDHMTGAFRMFGNPNEVADITLQLDK